MREQAAHGERRVVITIPLSPALMGSTAFGVSPLTEAAGSVRLLGDPRPPPFYRTWLANVGPRLDRDDLAVLSCLVPQGRWASTLMCPIVDGPRVTLEEQLEVLSRTSREELADDLYRIHDGGPLPPAALRLLSRGSAAGDRLATTMRSYWQVGLAPYWLRIRSALEADVAHRLITAGEMGLFSVLEDLHPEVSVDREALMISKPQHEAVTYLGIQLRLVPSVFVWPRLMVGHAHDRVELVYGARGVGQVWNADSLPRLRNGLSALLGRTRATVLTRVDLPVSTTELARQLGASPAGVNQHLSVLHRAGLVKRRRAGRTVWYTQTELGARLVRANQDN